MTQPQRLAVIWGLLIGLSACTTAAPEASVSQDAQGTAPAGKTEESPSQAASGTPSDTDSLPAPVTEQPTTENQEQAVNLDSDQIPDNPDAETAIAKTGLTEELDDDWCSRMATQQEMNRCAQERYQQANAELSNIYQDLQQGLPASGQQALSAAELAWVAFRDRDCTFAKDQFAGGSIVPLIYSSCLEAHTEERITELQQPQLPQLSYQAADDQLNATYQDLLAVLSESEADDITDVQLAWIEYRDRNCAFEILYSSDVIEESQCLARMSETRIAQLANDIEQRSL